MKMASKEPFLSRNWLKTSKITMKLAHIPIQMPITSLQESKVHKWFRQRIDPMCLIFTSAIHRVKILPQVPLISLVKVYNNSFLIQKHSRSSNHLRLHHRHQRLQLTHKDPWYRMLLLVKFNTLKLPKNNCAQSITSRSSVTCRRRSRRTK